MNASSVFLLSTMLAMPAAAQPKLQPQFDQVTSSAFLQQLLRDGVYRFISSDMAASLLIHRVEPVLPKRDMTARISGTVTVDLEIARDGTVHHAMAVSGPKMLQAPVLAAIRQWTFKPVNLNGQPVAVATTIQVPLSNFQMP
jgi:TonB family protein